MKKLLVFDIWSEYAHFKKPYTTTSPLTHSIPSRVTVAGLIGAIAGIEKNKVNKVLSPKKSNIALKIMKPIKKTNINFNYIDTKQAKLMSRMGRSPRTQIRAEYLKDVKYRIYIEIFDKSLHNTLKKLLEEHEAVYSVSLGLSENLANYEYIGEFEYCEQASNVNIESCINLNSVDIKNIEFKEETECFSDRLAREMTIDRTVNEYSDYLFERQGKTIFIKKSQYIKLENDEKIMFM